MSSHEIPMPDEQKIHDAILVHTREARRNHMEGWADRVEHHLTAIEVLMTLLSSDMGPVPPSRERDQPGQTVPADYMDDEMEKLQEEIDELKEMVPEDADPETTDETAP